MSRAHLRTRTMPAPTRTMPARKCRRTCAPPVPELLPVSVLLEIAARTDAITIFRCAATCKLFRREILSEDFVRRVCEGPGAVVPSRTLGLLGDETFSVVHPRTSAFRALERRYLSPFMSRRGSIIAAAGLAERPYVHRTSRNGLVVVSRREMNRRRKRDLCVYDPMAGRRACFLPCAPEIGLDPYHGLLGGVVVIDHCALLTAADGIGCSFMLLAADMGRKDLECKSVRIRVQTLSSSDSDAGAGGSARLGWSPVKTTADHPCPWWCMMSLGSDKDAAVVVSGVVHWLLHRDASFLTEDDDDLGEYILTYDVNAAAVGSVDIPKDRQGAAPLMSSSQLASSPDGKLSFVATHQCTVTVWVLSSSAGGSAWARHMEIDMMAVWGPMPGLEPGMDDWVELVEGLGDQRSGAVFLWFDGVFFVLDMKTGATSVSGLVGKEGFPYEVDLASRLASMKPF